MTPEEIEQQAKAFRENYIKEWPIQKVSDQIEMMAEFALHYHNQEQASALKEELTSGEGKCTKPNCNCAELEMKEQGTEFIKSYRCRGINISSLNEEKKPKQHPEGVDEKAWSLIQGFTNSLKSELESLEDEKTNSVAPKFEEYRQTPTPKDGEYRKYRKDTVLVSTTQKYGKAGYYLTFTDGETVYTPATEIIGELASHAEITQYWKDRIAAALPSDEDMEKWSTDSEKLWIVDEQIIAEQGAKWVRDKLKDL